MTLQNCPNCGHDLAPPLSSGRQVCMSCGWSDRPKKATYGSQSSQGANVFSDSSELRRILSALCHGSVFLSSIAVVPIVIPIVLFFASNDSIVRANAWQSIKFQLYSWAVAILLILAAMFAPFLILLILAIALALILVCIILPILGIIHSLTNEDTPYIYPLI